MAFQKLRNLLLVFFFIQRTGAVNKDAARHQIARGCFEQVALQRFDLRQIAASYAPAQIGTAVQHTESAARCVQEDRVKGSVKRCRQILGVAAQTTHVLHAEALHVFFDESHAMRMQIEGDDLSTVLHYSR